MRAGAEPPPDEPLPVAPLERVVAAPPYDAGEPLAPLERVTADPPPAGPPEAAAGTAPPAGADRRAGCRGLTRRTTRRVRLMTTVRTSGALAASRAAFGSGAVERPRPKAAALASPRASAVATGTNLRLKLFMANKLTTPRSSASQPWAKSWQSLRQAGRERC